MPRYLVERTLAEGSAFPAGQPSASEFLQIVQNNARDQVTWLHSYVSSDGRKAYEVCDGPSPEAVRHAAKANRLPVDLITEVRVLDPYVYVGTGPRISAGRAR